MEVEGGRERQLTVLMILPELLMIVIVCSNGIVTDDIQARWEHGGKVWSFYLGRRGLIYCSLGGCKERCNGGRQTADGRR